ncbi:unnamed protein product, partial [Mesorhabditis spiculigera]
MSAVNSSFELVKCFFQWLVSGFSGTPTLLSPPRAQGHEAEMCCQMFCKRLRARRKALEIHRASPPVAHANDDVFGALSRPLKMKWNAAAIEEDHGTVVSISCKNCNQSFPNSYTYRSHVDHCKLGTNKNKLKRISPITTMRNRDPLPDIAARRMLCVHCEEGFTSKEAIERHHLKHHAICLRFGDLCYTASTRRFVCRDSSCGYMEFNGWQKLISHYRTQHGEPAVQTRRVLLEGNVSAVTQLMQSQPRIVFPRTDLSAPGNIAEAKEIDIRSAISRYRAAQYSSGSAVASSSASFEDHSVRPHEIQDEAFDSPLDDFFVPENSVSFTPIDQTPIVGRSRHSRHHDNPSPARRILDQSGLRSRAYRQTDSEAAIKWDSEFWEQSSTVEIGPNEHPCVRELLALSREMADEENMTLD